MTKVTTKLKCKPCKLFYKDDGSVSVCTECGQPLKQIKVHYIKIPNVIIPMKMSNMKL